MLRKSGFNLNFVSKNRWFRNIFRTRKHVEFACFLTARMVGMMFLAMWKWGVLDGLTSKNGGSYRLYKDVRLKSGTPSYHPVSYKFCDRKPMRSPSDDSLTMLQTTSVYSLIVNSPRPIQNLAFMGGTSRESRPNMRLVAVEQLRKIEKNCFRSKYCFI